MINDGTGSSFVTHQFNGMVSSNSFDYWAMVENISPVVPPKAALWPQLLTCSFGQALFCVRVMTFAWSSFEASFCGKAPYRYELQTFTTMILAQDSHLSQTWTKRADWRVASTFMSNPDARCFNERRRVCTWAFGPRTRLFWGRRVLEFRVRWNIDFFSLCKIAETRMLASTARQGDCYMPRNV